MGRSSKRLTDSECKAAKPRDDGKSLILADGDGLRLVVKPHGAKEWQYRFTVATVEGGRKESALSLGQYPIIGLAAARAERDRIKGQVVAGKNPTIERQMEADRRTAAQVTTFMAVADELLKAKERQGVSDHYRRKIASVFRACLFPELGKMPIQDISPPVLKRVLKPVEERGKLDMLGFALRLSGEVFNLAKADNRYLGDNPADALKSNVFATHRSKHRQALPWDQMNGFLHRLDAGRLSLATSSAIRLLLLTAARPGEARGARWAEIDLDGACWSIPIERMKARVAHRVPLARQTVAMLRELHRLTGDGEYLFPGKRGSKAPCLTNMGLLQAVRLVAGHDLVDAHGFRAVFRTYAEESGLWSFESMECALAHGKKSAVVAAYARATHYPERVKLAQWYADELDQAKRGAVILKMKKA